jgi:hypothetical protein
MNKNTLHVSVRWISHIVLLLMAVALVYSAYISITHWSGIAV